MANVFDQFDQPAGNVFDQFDAPAQPKPTDGMSTGDLVAAGAGKFVVDSGRGLQQLQAEAAGGVKQVAEGDALGDFKIPGTDIPIGPGLIKYAPSVQIANYIAGKLGINDDAYRQKLQADIDAAKERDAPLMDTTAGKVGYGAGAVAATLPLGMVQGANTLAAATGAGAVTGAAQPVASDEGSFVEKKAKDVAIGGAAGVAGQALGQAIGSVAKKYSAAKKAAATAQKTANQVKDATGAMAKEAGYTIPPVQINPSKINRALEGWAGKLTTAQGASIKNQDVTNRMVKRALGLSPEDQLTPQALSNIRAEAGKAYEALRGAGQIATDTQYLDDLNSIVSKYQGAGKDFPELAKNEIADTVANLQKDSFASDSALDAIAILRDKADKAFRGGDKAYGRAYKQMADSVEGVLERSIASTGSDGAELLKDFRDARQLIAKTYSVESALNASTGNVNAKKLAQQLGRGKPLSGEIKKVAQFAQAFPKAAEEVASSMPGISPLDYTSAAMSAAASGNPGFLAMAAGRPMVRSAILSRPYQNMMTTPSYSPGIGVLPANALASPAVNPLLRSAFPALYATQE